MRRQTRWAMCLAGGECSQIKDVIINILSPPSACTSWGGPCGFWAPPQVYVFMPTQPEAASGCVVSSCVDVCALFARNSMVRRMEEAGWVGELGQAAWRLGPASPEQTQAGAEEQPPGLASPRQCRLFQLHSCLHHPRNGSKGHAACLITSHKRTY